MTFLLKGMMFRFDVSFFGGDYLYASILCIAKATSPDVRDLLSPSATCLRVFDREVVRNWCIYMYRGVH